MNANRMIDMIVRQVMRRLVTKGVDKGFDLAGRVGKPLQGQPSANDLQAAQHMKQNGDRQAQNMKQMQRMTRQMRRFMKF